MKEREKETVEECMLKGCIENNLSTKSNTKGINRQSPTLLHSQQISLAAFGCPQIHLPKHSYYVGPLGYFRDIYTWR